MKEEDTVHEVSAEKNSLLLPAAYISWAAWTQKGNWLMSVGVKCRLRIAHLYSTNKVCKIRFQLVGANWYKLPSTQLF